MIAANALVTLITGSDFRDSLRQNGVFHPSISVPLDQINGVLARAPGFRIEHRFQGQNLGLFLTKEPEAPGPIVH